MHKCEICNKYAKIENNGKQFKYDTEIETLRREIQIKNKVISSDAKKKKLMQDGSKKQCIEHLIEKTKWSENINKLELETKNKLDKYSLLMDANKKIQTSLVEANKKIVSLTGELTEKEQLVISTTNKLGKYYLLTNQNKKMATQLRKYSLLIDENKNQLRKYSLLMDNNKNIKTKLGK